MTGLDKVQDCMVQCLKEAGVRGVTAWSGEDRKRHKEAVVAVGLRSCRGEPSGFRDYLGERYNDQAGRWEELYGRRARLAFGLDIYGYGKEGAARCQTVFDRIADALQNAGPMGLTLGELSHGEIRYDEALGLFHCPAEAVCDAYLYAVADEGGTFVDFEVKGVSKA